MTPLERARANLKDVNCYNCGNMVVIDGTAYCEVSGKMIMPMHYETNRDNQCKGVFKARTGEIRREGS